MAQAGRTGENAKYKEARNRYTTAVKSAKKNHWEEFLSTETPQSIFRAMSYTKSTCSNLIPQIQDLNGHKQTTFLGKCEAFREKLFPPPPTSEPYDWTSYEPDHSWDWPSLTAEELQVACSSQGKGKAPGPDLLTQEIINKAYEAAPEEFLWIYRTLFDFGFQPTAWKEAVGVILRKPSKPDYSAPKAYRVISLLNCLGKVLERVYAKRLGFMAETTSLLHESQIGGRLRKSAIDAALLLTHRVQEAKRCNKRVSTLFLDVRGAFDHVSRERLLSGMAKLKLPTSLLAWVKSFLEDRIIQLTFDGQTESLTPVNTGIPQGSPVSPILFLIYVRDLFQTGAVQPLSYMDDFSLTACSSTWARNSRLLSNAATQIFQKGQEHAVDFDLDKTELLHFSTGDTSQYTVTLPNGATVTPKRLVRWLGVYFDCGLTFKEHIAIRTTQAYASFNRMARLANTERGLSPHAMRQLYMACVLSVADYGCQIYWKNQAGFAQKHQTLQGAALRRILGAFRTTPIVPMELEAALPPPHVRLNSQIRAYALRALTLAKSHPIRKSLAAIPDLLEGDPVRGKPTQLERVKDSIAHLSQLGLESIQHFHFPPWKRKLPYEVHVSKLPKDEEASRHKRETMETSPSHMYIYTDASSVPGGKGTGAAFVALCPSDDTIYASRGTNLGPGKLVYNGELEAIPIALEWAVSHGLRDKKIRVFADNQAALWRLKIPSDNPGQECQLRTIIAVDSLRQRGNTVSLHWVPGHTGVSGNERADSLAKEATANTPPAQDTKSFALYHVQIRAINRAEWETYAHEAAQKAAVRNPNTYTAMFKWKPRGRIKVPKTTRTAASAFYQLKFGHGYFKSYLHRFGKVESDTCHCNCTVKQTPRHLLTSCPAFSNARKTLIQSLSEDTGQPVRQRDLSLEVLLNSSLGIPRTLEFLQSTWISTRRWYLGLAPEEA